MSLVLCAVLWGCASADDPLKKIPHSVERLETSTLPVFKKQDFPQDHLQKLFGTTAFTWQKALLRLEQARLLYVQSVATQGASLNAGITAQQEEGQHLNPFAAAPPRLFSGFLQGNYDFDPFGRLSSLKKAQEKNYQAQYYDMRAVALELSKTYIQNYHQVVYAQNHTKILQQSLQIAEKNRQLILLKQKSGTAKAQDVITATQNLQALRVQMLQSQQAIIKNREIYANLLGMPVHELSQDSFKRFANLPPITQKISVPLLFLDKRPDVMAAYYRLKANKANVKAAIADLFPDLSFNLSVQNLGFTFAKMLQENNLFGQLSARLTQTLWDNGTLQSRVDFEKTALKMAQIDYLEKITKALNHIKTHETLYKNAYAVYQSALESDRLSKQNLAIVKQAYHYGKANVIELLRAEQALYESRLNTLNAHKALLDSYAEIITALGQNSLS